jgi:RNA polymerase-binding transcription factor DksA
MAVKKSASKAAKKAVAKKPVKKVVAKKAAKKPVKPTAAKKAKPAAKAKPAPKVGKKTTKTVKKTVSKPAAKKVAAKKAAPKPKTVKAAKPAKPVKAAAKPVKKAAPKAAAKPAKKAPAPVKKAAPAKPVAKATKPEVKKAAAPPPAPAKRSRKEEPAAAPAPSKPLVTQGSGPTMPRVTPMVKKVVSTLEAGDKERYSDSDLEEFREIIMAKLDEARKDYDLLKQTLANTDNNGTEDTSPSFKMIEDGSETLGREETAQLASRQEKFIKHLEDALLRIRNKTYGICRVTGKLISKERLRLVPHATLSIEAKQQMSN